MSLLGSIRELISGHTDLGSSAAVT
jgi:hypothetical protein